MWEPALRLKLTKAGKSLEHHLPSRLFAGMLLNILAVVLCCSRFAVIISRQFRKIAIFSSFVRGFFWTAYILIIANVSCDEDV